MCTDYIKDIKRYPAHQNEMGSRPLAGLHHMSCMSGENSNLQRAQGTRQCFPGWLTLAGASQRMTAKTRVELVNANELFRSKFIVDWMQ